MSSYRDRKGSAGSTKGTRHINLLANVIAALILTFPPAAYSYLTYRSCQAQLQAETTSGAHLVTDFINKRPDLWKFDEIRLRALLSINRDAGGNEIRRVLDGEGAVIAQVGQTAAKPVSIHSHDLRDAGRVVGRYVIIRSARPILAGTGWAALVGGFLATAALLFFHLFPMRTLRRTLESLSDERDRAHVTLESIGDCVIVTDTDGRIVTLNKAGEQSTEWTQGDARGKSLHDVFPVRKANADVAGDLSVHGLEETREFDRDLLTDRKGTERIIEGAISPIFDRHDRRRGAVLVCRDVTEKVRVEEEVFKARKRESIGFLSGGIAHDFNNILVGILGYLSLLKTLASPGTRMHERIGEAEKASSRAKELSARILVFSKGGKPIRKPLSVASLVKESATLAARGSRCRLSFHLPETLRMAEADSVQMGQVISNLIINAAQSMPQGGTIRVEAENAVVAEGEITHVTGGMYEKIFVRDQGTGIPENIVKKVFDPYFTTKNDGNGLGLTTCYTIMKSHGGNIFVESEEGVGSPFILFLPASRRIAPLEAKAPEEGFVPGSGRILVMDDDETVLDVAAQMLSHLGYETVLARNGEEAISLFEETSSGEREFDLVILDLTIPGGMGGDRVGEADPGNTAGDENPRLQRLLKRHGNGLFPGIRVRRVHCETA